MCNIYLLLKIVCTDTSIIDLLLVVNGGLICSFVFLLLPISYRVILHGLQNLSQEERQKVLKTCGSHIAGIVCFFVPCVFMYGRPDKTFSMYKSVSVFYTVIAPILNPLIYTLRNSDMKNAMRNLWRRNISHRT